MTFKNFAKIFLTAALFCMIASPANARFLDGLNAYMNGDYDTALLEWAESARLGEAKSMAYIGYLYFGGLGGYQDDEKALEWFNKAADLDDPDAIATLARMYAHGWGVKRDIDKAHALMIKVAHVDNFAAQMTASEFYEMGFGTPVDLEKALEHAKKLPLQENGLSVETTRNQRIGDLERKVAEENKTR